MHLFTVRESCIQQFVASAAHRDQIYEGESNRAPAFKELTF